MRLASVAYRRSSCHEPRASDGDGLDARPTAFAEELIEIGNGSGEPVAERGRRSPAEQFGGEGDVGAALGWIVDRKRAVDDDGPGAGQRDDQLGQFGDRGLLRVAEVD